MKKAIIKNDLNAIANVDAVREIVALRGLGVWSAEIYLMLSLQRRRSFLWHFYRDAPI